MTSIRLRAHYRNGITTVKSIIRHPMDNGFKKDANGTLIPEHYIREVICKHDDNEVLHCHWSRAVSKNPYLSFKFAGAKPGDTISIYWIDTKGQSDIAKADIE